MNQFPKLKNGQTWGCGQCGGENILPKESAFEYSREEFPNGDVISKTSKVYVTACCEAELMLWDDAKEDFIDNWQAAPLPAVAPTPGNASDAGLEQAAKHIEQKAADYDSEHGSTDSETGTREYPGDGAEYYNSMMELAEDIRALSPLTADPRLDDLSALVRRLARSLSQAAPDNKLPAVALDYLDRKGLKANILRADAECNASDALIREVFMRNGFTIKDGQTDLKPYVYSAARELLEDADVNATWLTTAHSICADAGIPPGRISERLEKLREMQAHQVAPVAAQGNASDVRQEWLYSIDKAIKKLAQYWRGDSGCAVDLTELRAYIECQLAASVAVQCKDCGGAGGHEAESSSVSGFWKPCKCKLAAQDDASDVPVSAMTAKRAAFFMERFRREEKLLGPNEQAALKFVIDMLESTPVAAQGDAPSHSAESDSFSSVSEREAFEKWWTYQQETARNRLDGDDWFDLNEDDKQQYRSCWNSAIASRPQAKEKS